MSASQQFFEPFETPHAKAHRRLGDRLWVSLCFLLLILAGPPYGFDHLGATSVLNRFWLGTCSALALVPLFVVFFHGGALHKIGAILLFLVAAVGLYESISYLVFDLLHG